jgi:hypothetical protein
MYAYYLGRKCYHQDSAFPYLLFLCRHVIRACTHNHTTYLVCSHSNQHICFNPTYCPWEQWLEIRSILNPGKLVSHTQVFDPDKPVSVFFDAYAAIDQGGCGGICCICEGLAWERDYYMSNDKYMCQGDNSWLCTDMGSYYWSCISWATWQKAEHAALLHKGIAAPDCTLGTCIMPSNWKQIYN